MMKIHTNEQSALQVRGFSLSHTHRVINLVVELIPANVNKHEERECACVCCVECPKAFRALCGSKNQFLW